MAEVRPEMFAELRGLAFKADPSALKLPTSDAHASYGAIMDLNLDGRYATIVGFSNGEASVYLSTGGGFIGGGAHEAVALAAKRFVAAAERAGEKMSPAVTFPLPSAGMTTFYALTGGGVLYADDWEEDFRNGTSAFTDMYAAGHGVITAYRTLPGIEP